jgi:hypothetical protein
MINKRMAKIAPLWAFIVGTGVALFVFASSEVEIFPCTKTVRERSAADPWSEGGPLVTTQASCSFKAHLRDDAFNPAERSQLSGAGWALLIALSGGLGLANAALTHRLIRRMPNKAEQA